MAKGRKAEIGIIGLTDAVEIGRGGFAIVYRAFQAAFERFVAVKVFADRTLDEPTLEAFQRECRAIGRVSGTPNILTVYGAGITGTNEPYMVMPYMSGGSLDDRMRREGHIPWRAVVDIGVKLATALQVAHDAAVLHRDVKPENVLLSEGGEPYLADFGIARLTDTTRMATSRLAFTPAHVAPEILEGGSPTPSVDVYSLGSTLFALIAGRPAFVEHPDDTFYQVIGRVQTAPLPDLLRPQGVPGPVRTALEAAMARDPRDRPSSAAAFGAALRDAVDRARQQDDPRLRAAGEHAASRTTVAPSRTRAAERLGGGRPAASPGVLHGSVPRPGLLDEGFANATPTAYFGVRLSSAVNLLEAREYGAMSRRERLDKALAEQQVFLEGLLDPSLNAAFDLRVIVDPRRSPPIDIVVLGRTWSEQDAEANNNAGDLARYLQASLPHHVVGEVMDDANAVAAALCPFDDPDGVESVVITKSELIALPMRPDAKVGYYFSVVPFNWAGNDWTSLYSALAASPTPLVVSVGLLPIRLSASFSDRLQMAATQYGRLAREDQRGDGLFYGRQLVPPDPFAVEGERVFTEFMLRYRDRAFVMRIQVSAPGPIPAGIADAVAATISPPHAGASTTIGNERAVSASEIRPALMAHHRALASWNLRSIDFRLIPGRGEIWNRPDPPAKDFQLLSVLGDAGDASCGWRFPVAVDGTVPGFRVRRGQLGQVERYQADSPSISLGRIPGGGGEVTFAVDSLTRHALIVGCTGSGKTTTVIELLRQLWLDHHVPFLVVEPANADADDYRRLLRVPGFDQLTVYTVGDESGRPLRFNPFAVPKNLLVGEHIANLLACFSAAFGLSASLTAIYQDAIDATYLAAGILASERADGLPRTWPTVVEFVNAMRQVTDGLGYDSAQKHTIAAASIGRAEKLVRGVSASVFLTDRPEDLVAVLRGPVILELRSLGQGDEQTLMTALVLNSLTESHQALGGAFSSHLVHLTVVEEAHRLLARSTGANVAEEVQAKERAARAFANSLAENRKFGEGIVIVEQSPTKLVQDAVTNTNLKVMHRVTAEEDRRYLGETMGLDESQMRVATRLVTGDAVVYSDEFAEAVEIRVEPRTLATAPLAVAPMVAPPFRACDLCRAQCRYRGAALAIVGDRAIVDDVFNACVGNDWAAVGAALRSRVALFSSMPSVEPGLSDAAYCVFLHALGVRTMSYPPLWPQAVAHHLGILGGPDR